MSQAAKQNSTVAPAAHMPNCGANTIIAGEARTLNTATELRACIDTILDRIDTTRVHTAADALALRNAEIRFATVVPITRGDVALKVERMMALLACEVDAGVVRELGHLADSVLAWARAGA